MSARWCARAGRSSRTGSTVAYTRAFDVGGRTFLVAARPGDRPEGSRPPLPALRRSTASSSAATSRCPIAFFRKTDRPKYRRGDDGIFAQTGERWPRLAWVALTGDAG